MSFLELDLFLARCPPSLLSYQPDAIRSIRDGPIFYLDKREVRLRILISFLKYLEMLRMGGRKQSQTSLKACNKGRLYFREQHNSHRGGHSMTWLDGPSMAAHWILLRFHGPCKHHESWSAMARASWPAYYMSKLTAAVATHQPTRSAEGRPCVNTVVTISAFSFSS